MITEQYPYIIANGENYKYTRFGMEYIMLELNGGTFEFLSIQDISRFIFDKGSNVTFIFRDGKTMYLTLTEQSVNELKTFLILGTQLTLTTQKLDL